MSISILQQPASYSPAHNDLYYVVSGSNQTNNSFKFIFDVFADGNFISRHRLPLRLNQGLAVFNPAQVLKSLVSVDIPLQGEQGFQQNFYSNTNYNIQVGEEYIPTGSTSISSTTAIATGTTNLTYNAVYEFIDWQN